MLGKPSNWSLSKSAARDWQYYDYDYDSFSSTQQYQHVEQPEYEPDEPQQQLLADEGCINVNEGILETFNDLTQRQSIRIAFGVLYSAVFLPAIVFNAGVILTVYRNRKLRSTSNIFLLNLMAADLLLCLTALPVTPISVVRKQWIFGSFLCRFLPLSQSWSVLVTSWSLTAIALDKYLHIRYQSMAPFSSRQSLLITGAIIILSGIVNIPYVLSYDIISGSLYGNGEPNSGYCGEFCEETNWSSEIARRVYGSTIMSLQFIIPTVIITFCYSRILGIVSRDMIIANSSFAQSLTTNQRKFIIRKKRKATYTLIAMVITFIACWFPLTMVNILRDFAILPSFIENQPWLVTLIVHIIAMTTVLWNPLLFFYLTKKSRSSAANNNAVRFNAILTDINSFRLRHASSRRSNRHLHFDKSADRSKIMQQSDNNDKKNNNNSNHISRTPKSSNDNNSEYGLLSNKI